MIYSKIVNGLALNKGIINFNVSILKLGEKLCKTQIIYYPKRKTTLGGQ